MSALDATISANVFFGNRGDTLAGSNRHEGGEGSYFIFFILSFVCFDTNGRLLNVYDMQNKKSPGRVFEIADLPPIPHTRAPPRPNLAQNRSSVKVLYDSGPVFPDP